jgi:adenine phosphoribosyltransferase
VSASYKLEYGSNSLELHPDLIPKGSRVVVHDDVLATGGTVEAINGLVRQLGGVVVGACFIIELTFLGGRARLADCDLHALIEY